MKSFYKVFAAMIVIIILIFAGTNLYLYLDSQNSHIGRPYRVEAGRLSDEIIENGFSNIDLSAYKYVKHIEKLENEQDVEFFEGENSDYLIKEISGSYYRFDYISDSGGNLNKIISVNVSLLIMTAAVIGLMTFTRIRLLKPFNRLKDVPYELSKGNLSIPLKESKNRFFGSFIWGMDLLRENIEKQRIKEQELVKDKKTLILSISHDIKTPLSAIKLYAKALSKNLYDNTEKQKEIAENINSKADEIENFVSQIIKASSEDFLNLEVNKGEFYFSEMINRITGYYTEKLELLKIGFNVAGYSDCILVGDLERAVEVLQNIMENAVKYGDGRIINLTVSEEEGCRLVKISNSGCTLPSNEMTHIFDCFWRGSNVGSNGGSGLGLYICRQLMTKMDGDIFSSSENGFMEITLVFQRV